MDQYNSHINKFAGENYQSALSELEVKYETEKKEYQITALEKQKLWMTVAIGIALVAMALLVIYYIGRSRLMKERERLNQEKLERLEREKQLVATQAALEGETSERSRLARDLHDGLGSMLSVVKHSIPAIQAGTVIDSESEKRFNRALGLLDESIGELRRIAHHMMPESLIRLGLKEALQDFCQAHEKLTFAFYGNEERIDSKLEVLIYRAVQELVTNALKHAQASMINVQVIQEPRRISITVEDNGKGFEVKQTGKSGMGLQNLKHRVHSYGGIMDISSGKGGTEIIMEFEIKPYTI
jgi:two-component system NarL family sensor kinase